MTSNIQNLFHYKTEYLSLKDITNILIILKKLGLTTINASIISNNK
jgi:hypothetical protein